MFAGQLLKTKPNKQDSVWGNGGHAFVRINWYDVNTTGSLLYCILRDNVRAGCQWTQTGNCGLWHLDLACLLQSLKKGCCSMSETAWRELGNECMSSVSMTTMDVIPGKCICMISWILKKWIRVLSLSDIVCLCIWIPFIYVLYLCHVSYCLSISKCSRILYFLLLI